jgi:hypothetical protein
LKNSKKKMNRWSHRPKKENRDENKSPNNNFSPAHPYADIDKNGSNGGSAGIVQVSDDYDSGRDQRNFSDH